MHRSGLAVAVCALLLAGGRARAEAKSDAERAKALFDQALKLEDKGDHGNACPLFKSAVELEPNAVGGKFHLARCYRQLGKLASALSEYQQAESAAIIAGQKARAAVAREQIDALSKQVATLAIVVPEPFRKLYPELVVRLDGDPIPASSWDLPHPVDAGSHQVRAVTGGAASWSARLDIHDGDRAAVDVSARPTRPIWPWLAGGLGLALGAVAVGFGVDLARTASTINAHCPRDVSLPCDVSDGFDDTAAFHRRDRDTGVVVAASIAGAAGIGAGIAGLVLAHRKPAATALSPWIGVRAAGISLQVDGW